MANMVVDKLVKKLDEEISVLSLSNAKLVLLGDWNSPFLKSVRRKANEFGVVCAEHCMRPDGVVADVETCQMTPHLQQIIQENDLDIDNPSINGMTSVAHAVYMILDAYKNIEGKHISIVGRGHAVTGLANRLIRENATVTVVHSQTRDILSAIDGSDVIVYATPELIVPRRPDAWDMVVDLGGVWADDPYTNCEYIDRVGPLTVSILMRRLAEKVNRAVYI